MPQDLVADFKVGHQAILTSIDRSQSYLRSYLEAKPNIRGMHQTLLAHFGRENDELFKRLRDYYREDRQATKMIDFLTVDLKDVKIRFLTFFEKYTGEMGDMGSKSFPKDFTDFSNGIIGRIKIEEDYLFPLIAKLPD